MVGSLGDSPGKGYWSQSQPGRSDASEGLSGRVHPITAQSAGNRYRVHAVTVHFVGNRHKIHPLTEQTQQNES